MALVANLENPVAMSLTPPSSADGNEAQMYTIIQGHSWFSTNGGKRPVRYVDPGLPEPEVVVRTDFDTDVGNYIDLLRSQYPHVCMDVFAPWDIRWYFDQWDFHVLGGEFCYPVLERMQKENERRLVEFCNGWMATNGNNSWVLEAEVSTIDTVFTKDDVKRFGRYFMQRCFSHLRESYLKMARDFESGMLPFYPSLPGSAVPNQTSAGPPGLASQYIPQHGPIFVYGAQHTTRQPARMPPGQSESKTQGSKTKTQKSTPSRGKRRSGSLTENTAPNGQLHSSQTHWPPGTYNHQFAYAQQNARIDSNSNLFGILPPGQAGNVSLAVPIEPNDNLPFPHMPVMIPDGGAVPAGMQRIGSIMHDPNSIPPLHFAYGAPRMTMPGPVFHGAYQPVQPSGHIISNEYQGSRRASFATSTTNDSNQTSRTAVAPSSESQKTKDRRYSTSNVPRRRMSLINDKRLGEQNDQSYDGNRSITGFSKSRQDKPPSGTSSGPSPSKYEIPAGVNHVRQMWICIGKDATMQEAMVALSNHFKFKGLHKKQSIRPSGFLIELDNTEDCRKLLQLSKSNIKPFGPENSFTVQVARAYLPRFSRYSTDSGSNDKHKSEHDEATVQDHNVLQYAPASEPVMNKKFSPQDVRSSLPDTQIAPTEAAEPKDMAAPKPIATYTAPTKSWANVVKAAAASSATSTQTPATKVAPITESHANVPGESGIKEEDDGTPATATAATKITIPKDIENIKGQHQADHNEAIIPAAHSKQDEFHALQIQEKVDSSIENLVSSVVEQVTESTKIMPQEPSEIDLGALNEKTPGESGQWKTDGAGSQKKKMKKGKNKSSNAALEEMSRPSSAADPAHGTGSEGESKSAPISELSTMEPAVQTVAPNSEAEIQRGEVAHTQSHVELGESVSRSMPLQGTRNLYDTLQPSAPNETASSVEIEIPDESTERSENPRSDQEAMNSGNWIDTDTETNGKKENEEASIIPERPWTADVRQCFQLIYSHANHMQKRAWYSQTREIFHKLSEYDSQVCALEQRSAGSSTMQKERATLKKSHFEALISEETKALRLHLSLVNVSHKPAAYRPPLDATEFVNVSKIQPTTAVPAQKDGTPLRQIPETGSLFDETDSSLRLQCLASIWRPTEVSDAIDEIDRFHQVQRSVDVPLALATNEAHPAVDLDTDVVSAADSPDSFKTASQHVTPNDKADTIMSQESGTAEGSPNMKKYPIDLGHRRKAQVVMPRTMSSRRGPSAQKISGAPEKSADSKQPAEVTTKK